MKAQLETEKTFMWISSVTLCLFPEQVLPCDSHYYLRWKLMGGVTPYLMALFIGSCFKKLLQSDTNFSILVV